MAIRFRRSIKVAPGMRINLGKKGVSASFGPRGAKTTIGTSGRVTSTIGAPGTGLSYTSTTNLKQGSVKTRASSPRGAATPANAVTIRSSTMIDTNVRTNKGNILKNAVTAANVILIIWLSVQFGAGGFWGGAALAMAIHLIKRGVIKKYFMEIRPIEHITETVYEKTLSEDGTEFLFQDMFGANRCKIAVDCLNLTQKTIDTGVYFTRYDLLIETLEAIINSKMPVLINRNFPQEFLLKVKNEKEQRTVFFLERTFSNMVSGFSSLKTQRGRLSRVDKLANELRNLPMSDVCSTKLLELVDKAKEVARS